MIAKLQTLIIFKPLDARALQGAAPRALHVPPNMPQRCGETWKEIKVLLLRMNYWLGKFYWQIARTELAAMLLYEAGFDANGQPHDSLPDLEAEAVQQLLLTALTPPCAAVDLNPVRALRETSRPELAERSQLLVALSGTLDRPLMRPDHAFSFFPFFSVLFRSHSKWRGENRFS